MIEQHKLMIRNIKYRKEIGATWNQLKMIYRNCRQRQQFRNCFFVLMVTKLFIKFPLSTKIFRKLSANNEMIEFVLVLAHSIIGGERNNESNWLILIVIVLLTKLQRFISVLLVCQRSWMDTPNLMCQVSRRTKYKAYFSAHTTNHNKP